MKKIDIRKKEKNETFQTLWLKDQFQKFRMNPELDRY